MLVCVLAVNFAALISDTLSGLKKKVPSPWRSWVLLLYLRLVSLCSFVAEGFLFMITLYFMLMLVDGEHNETTYQQNNLGFGTSAPFDLSKNIRTWFRCLTVRFSF